MRSRARKKCVAVLAAADAPASAAADVRAVVAAYEAVVHTYPASGYCDNALWQAGRLALDLFAKFGDARDRDAGVRLLRRLAASYPSSRFVAQVPDILSGVNRADNPPVKAATVQPTPDSPVDRGAGSAQASPRATTGTRIATIRDIRRSVLPTPCGSPSNSTAKCRFTTS